MKKLIVIIALVCASCTRPEAATKVLEDAGYTHIEIEGYGAFACSDDDTYATKFTAIGPTGKPVSGVVCQGLLKGATIRFD